MHFGKVVAGWRYSGWSCMSGWAKTEILWKPWHRQHCSFPEWVLSATKLSYLIYHTLMMLYFSRSQRKTTLTTSDEFNMDNKLQAMLTLVSVLAAAVQLNSSLNNGTTTYMNRRRAIIQEICDSSRVQHYSYMERRGKNQCLGWFLSMKLWLLRNRRENFWMSRSGLIRPWMYLQGYSSMYIINYLSNEGRLKKTANTCFWRINV